MEPAWYEIRVEKELDVRWAEWFGGLGIEYNANGDETILRGVMVDQCALFGVLGKVRDLGLTLVAVQRRPSTPLHSAQDELSPSSLTRLGPSRGI